MIINRRIFISMPADSWLTYEQNELKWGIVDAVEALGYVPEVFNGPIDRRRPNSLTFAISWAPDRVVDVLRRCVGAVLIGLPRWKVPSPNGELRLPTEFSHYEGGIIDSFKLPVIHFVEHNLVKRVAFSEYSQYYINAFPENVGANWLKSTAFKNALSQWHNQVSQRDDIFLGYSSGAADKAQSLISFLTENGVKVRDWQKDFVVGGSIISQIQQAAKECSSGIFLFTNDDELEGMPGQAAPRDNVVFEAGYFAHAKGDDRILIIREEGAKMPADLGGKIYLTLPAHSTSVDPISLHLLDFLRKRV